MYAIIKSYFRDFNQARADQLDLKENLLATNDTLKNFRYYTERQLDKLNRASPTKTRQDSKQSPSQNHLSPREYEPDP